MRTLGIGTDLAKIARIKRLLQQYDTRFVERILHPNEQARFQHISDNHKTAWLTKRFASKEALSKALGTGIGKQARLKDIECITLESGQPTLKLHDVTLNTATQMGVTDIQISLSDEGEYALAFVVLQGSDSD